MCDRLAFGADIAHSLQGGLPNRQKTELDPGLCLKPQELVGRKRARRAAQNRDVSVDLVSTADVERAMPAIDGDFDRDRSLAGFRHQNQAVRMALTSGKGQRHKDCRRYLPVHLASP